MIFLGSFICGVLMFIFWFLIWYVLIERALKKTTPETQDSLALLEAAIKSCKSKDEIAILLLYHTQAQDAESSFLRRVASIRLEELGEEPSCADSEPGADDRERGEQEGSP